ncbi:MAG: flagellar hook-associated protein FlgK [Comamonadaceae bacterium]|nr:flagellar hook-associated protein FlgK [Comamonadaceae bacterium]
MSGLLNVASRALVANQTVLQTTGNNIANVNTPGYSRQSAVLQTVAGQFSGSGYIGKGVDVVTIQRNYSEFLVRQSTLAGATSAGDTARADKLRQLEGIFPGGASALGASVSDMLNAFSDVANAPTDLTARTVALTRVGETASRMRSASQSLDDLQTGVTQEITQKIDAINSLAKSIADVNDRIAKAQGTGQTPNDLMDQREQLVRELNQYIQTSSIAATDGTVGIFIGGSQALVLGNSAAELAVSSDDFNDPLKTKLVITRTGQSVTMDESRLGGGEVPGLLRFQNNDLVEGRNLLGRLTLAISTSMNDQHRLGLDLDGNVGGDLFTPTVFGSGNVMVPSAPATVNTGGAALSLGISDVTQFAASDYEVLFSTASSGSITRRSDNTSTAFDFGTTNPVIIDGLSLTWDGVAAGAGDRFLIKPFSTSASNIAAEFSTPRALAVASPVVGKMGTSNTGSLQLASLRARTNPPAVETTNTPVVLTFTGPNSFTRDDEIPPNTTTFAYTSGQTIEGTTPASSPLSEWSLVLQGSPKAGDTFTVFGIKDAANNNGINLTLNSGNAAAMINLRDTAMFDGSALTDGYASMISQIGIRTQSANYSASVSSSIAANLEEDRTGVSGVNLDEEAAKLLQFQQAYQASAKVIQIAQSIFDTLIQTLSR